MKNSRLKLPVTSIFVMLALAVSSFAAPLCACLDLSAKTHACCDKMKGHCPMKHRPADSLDKVSHSGCDCFAEKRETVPTKISESSRSQQTSPALMPGVYLFDAALEVRPATAVFSEQISPSNTFPASISARGPPCL